MLWGTQLNKGKKGEAAIIRLMHNRGHKVIDLTNNPQYYDADIDFIISGHTCELKTDYVINRTNNLFLEDYIVYNSGAIGEGYLRKSKAEYLFYYNINSEELYIYNFADLRAAVNNKRYKHVNDGYKVVYGYCINKEVVPHQIIKEVKSYDF